LFDSGEVEVDGKVVRLKSPSDAIQAGIGLVPEDRKEQGLVLPFSIMHNISLPLLRRLARFQIIDARGERRVARQFVDRLGIRTPSTRLRVSLLSGGNQQRVVLAKWLATTPKVLIVDEPTRGVDVAAKAGIYTLLSQLASQGMGILMISSELPEILAMSDRIMVMHQGRITGELPASTATQERIMRLATGQQELTATARMAGEAHAI